MNLSFEKFNFKFFRLTLKKSKPFLVYDLDEMNLKKKTIKNNFIDKKTKIVHSIFIYLVYPLTSRINFFIATSIKNGNAFSFFRKYIFGFYFLLPLYFLCILLRKKERVKWFLYNISVHFSFKNTGISFLSGEGFNFGASEKYTLYKAKVQSSWDRTIEIAVRNWAADHPVPLKMDTIIFFKTLNTYFYRFLMVVEKVSGRKNHNKISFSLITNIIYLEKAYSIVESYFEHNKTFFSKPTLRVIDEIATHHYHEIIEDLVLLQRFNYKSIFSFFCFLLNCFRFFICYLLFFLVCALPSFYKIYILLKKCFLFWLILFYTFLMELKYVILEFFKIIKIFYSFLYLIYVRLFYGKIANYRSIFFFKLQQKRKSWFLFFAKKIPPLIAVLLYKTGVYKFSEDFREAYRWLKSSSLLNFELTLMDESGDDLMFGYKDNINKKTKIDEDLELEVKPLLINGIRYDKYHQFTRWVWDQIDPRRHYFRFYYIHEFVFLEDGFEWEDDDDDDDEDDDDGEFEFFDSDFYGDPADYSEASALENDALFEILNSFYKTRIGFILIYLGYRIKEIPYLLTDVLITYLYILIDYVHCIKAVFLKKTIIIFPFLKPFFKLNYLDKNNKPLKGCLSSNVSFFKMAITSFIVVEFFTEMMEGNHFVNKYQISFLSPTFVIMFMLFLLCLTLDRDTHYMDLNSHLLEDEDDDDEDDEYEAEKMEEEDNTIFLFTIVIIMNDQTLVWGLIFEQYFAINTGTNKTEHFIPTKYHDLFQDIIQPIYYVYDTIIEFFLKCWEIIVIILF